MAIKPTEQYLQETADSTELLQALTALRMAKEEVIKLHQKSGLPIVIWRNGAVYLQSPADAQRDLEDSKRGGVMKNSQGL